MFVPLYFELTKQSFGKSVEILYEEDNKQMPIGTKRQKLLERAQGEYIVFFDSDDEPMPYYIDEILKALETKPDCLGFIINMTTNGGKPETCIHSLKYPNWYSQPPIHYRNVTHFNCAKREIALKAGFGSERFGEDLAYANRLTPLCKTEVFVEKPIFHYKFTNHEKHSIKYGISK